MGLALSRARFFSPLIKAHQVVTGVTVRLGRTDARLVQITGFLAACLFLAICKNGIWVIPNVDRLLAMAQNITTVNLPPETQYLYAAFLGPLVAGLLGANGSIAAFAGLHFAVLCLSYFLIGIFLHLRRGPSYAVLYGLLFLALPVSSPTLNWLGYADAWTFALLSLIVLFEGPVLRLLLASLMAINHFEEGIFFLVSASVVLAFVDGRKWLQFAIPVTAGLIAGKLGLFWYFHHYNMVLYGTHLSYLTGGGLLMFGFSLIANPIALAWSLFGGGWAALWVAWKARPDEKLARAALFGFAICAIAVPVVLDKTKDFAMLSWPIVLLLMLRADVSWLQQNFAAFCKVLTVAAVIPTIMVWDSVVYSSTTTFTARYLAACIIHKPLHGSLSAPFGIPIPPKDPQDTTPNPFCSYH